MFKTMAYLGTVVILIAETSLAAIPSKYQVSMRIDLKGQLPIAISTPVKTGKKSSFTEISSDGQTETNVEVVSRKSRHQEKDGLWMDIKVTRSVRGKVKNQERAQIFAFENQEAELITGKRGKKAPEFAISVLAHPI